jgi:O-antigen ligase
MNNVTTATYPKFLSQPKSIAWTVILITIAWALLQWALSGIVFLAIVVVFIIGFKKPMWAIAALLFQQLTITSYMVPTPFVMLSLRLILLMLTLFILRGAIARKEIDLGPHARRLIIPALLLITVSVVANTVNSIGFNTVFKDFRNMVTGLLFAILLPAVIDNSKQLKTVLSFALVIATASGLIAIFQHYNILGMGQATLIPNFFNLLKRAPGMSEMELELSYMLSVILIIVFGVFIGNGLSMANKKLLIIPAIPMLLGLYFSYTRSAIFALGCGILSLVMFIRVRGKWWIIMTILFIVLIFLENSDVIAGAGVRGRSDMEQMESSVARAVLWQAGVAMIADHPFLGIGSEQFIALSPQYTARVDPSLISWEANRYWSYRTLGNDPPHNDYLMMWVSYGVFALIIYLWLHFVILSNLMNSYFKSNSRFVKALSLGLAGALVTYVANSFYHNLLDTMPLFWIVAGFSLVMMKLAAKDKKQNSIKLIPKISA